MKLREFIAELEKLGRPEADVCFETVEYQGNGTASAEIALVDATLRAGAVMIRVAVPYDVEKIKDLES